MKKLTGIYTITNIINNKVYVGSAIKCFLIRWGEHKSKLRRNYHSNKHLQSAWNKYGEENFVFEILEETLPEYAISQEQYWINMLNVCNDKFGYNICSVAGNTKGNKLSEESIQKLKDSLFKIREKRISNKQSKRVAQYTMEGIFIKEFRSIKEAMRETNVYEEGISKCCKKIFKSSHGFKWKYIKTKIKRNTFIEQFPEMDIFKLSSTIN